MKLVLGLVLFLTSLSCSTQTIYSKETNNDKEVAQIGETYTAETLTEITDTTNVEPMLEVPLNVVVPEILEYEPPIQERPIAVPKSKQEISHAIVITNLPQIELPDIEVQISNDTQIAATEHQVTEILPEVGMVADDTVTFSNQHGEPQEIHPAVEVPQIKAQVAFTPPVSLVSTNIDKDSLEIESSAINSIADFSTITRSENDDEQVFSTDEEIMIALIGHGYVYLNSTLENDIKLDENSALEFIRKDYTGNGELFYFRAPFEGLYTVEFVRQDLTSGLQEQIRKKIKVDDLFEVARWPTVENNSDQEELVSSAQEPDAEQLNQFDEVFNSTGADEIVSDLLHEDPIDNELEETELFNELISWTDIQSQIAQGDFDGALQSIGNRRAMELSISYDELIFTKAQILEKANENRNISEAIKLYTQIIEQYPDSRFWNESENRFRYIQRNFFRIR